MRHGGQPAQKHATSGRESLAEFLQDSLWGWVGLLFAIAFLGWSVVRLRAWFRDDSDPADDSGRMLSEIREMYHEGDLSEEEYRSIKGRLVQRLDEQFKPLRSSNDIPPSSKYPSQRHHLPRH